MAALGIPALITRVRKLLQDEGYEGYATAGILVGDTTVTVDDPTAWAVGDIVEPRDQSAATNVEQMRVRSIPNNAGVPPINTNPLTVKRAHNDTTAIAHANSVVLLKNPRYPAHEILESLYRTCFDMWPRVWDQSNFTITPVANQTLYAAPADLQDLVSATQDDSASTTAVWTYGTRHQGYPALVARNLPAADIATGIAVYLPLMRRIDTGIFVTYRRVLTADQVPEGLIADALVLGAVGRMLLMRQVVRSGQDIRQGEPGSPGAYLQDASGFLAEFESKVGLAQRQLVAAYPQALWRQPVM